MFSSYLLDSFYFQNDTTIDKDISKIFADRLFIVIDRNWMLSLSLNTLFS